MTNEENIERLADKVGMKMLAEILAKGYDENTLSVIAKQEEKNAKLFVQTKLSVEAVDAIVRAYSEKIIDGDDLLHIMRYSAFSSQNEVDTRRFIERIKGGMNHRTAAAVFVAENYENGGFDSLADKVESGAYFPTKYGTLSLSYDVAKVLFGLKVPLRASRKGSVPEEVSEVDENIRNGDCIRGGNYKLVQAIKQYMDKPDWTGFYKFLLSRDSENISAEMIEKQYSEYTAALKSERRR